MSQGKRLSSQQTAVQIISQRSFRAGRTSNRLIAAAAIIVVILITPLAVSFLICKVFLHCRI